MAPSRERSPTTRQPARNYRLGMKQRVAHSHLRTLVVAAIAVAFCHADTFAAPAPARYVLLLSSFDFQFVPYEAFANVFRAELRRTSPEPIVLLESSLELAPSRTSPDDEQLAEYLRLTLNGRQLDLIVPIGGPAAAFVQKHRQQLFPTTPVLYSAVDRRFLETSTFSALEAAVAVQNDPPLTVNTILRVLPDVTNVFVVIGNSRLERFWKTELTQEFQQFKGRLMFTWADKYSFPQLQEQVAALPSHSAILFPLYALDAAGQAIPDEQALKALRAVTNAPIFGFHTPQMGRGIVGGPLLSIEDLGRTTSTAAVRILRGDSPSTIRVPVQTAGTPVFDWRELRRWDIDERRLPPNSSVLFRGVTVWQRYRPQIVVGALFILSQAAVIFALVFVQLKRRRAERAVQESEARFRLLADSAPVMIWLSGADMLCNDFNERWLEFTGRPLEAELGNGWADGVHPDDKERCIKTYVDAFTKRESFDMEYRLRRHDGEYRWILDCGVPRFDPNGLFAGYVGSAVDISPQKLAEMALADLNRMLVNAHETERALIASELHDDIGQRIAGLTALLYSLRDGMSSRWNSANERFAQICTGFSELGRDVGALSHRLHPITLEILGLWQAARALCEQVADQHGINIEFRGDPVSWDLPKNVKFCLFRVLQEALNNAVKHSGSRHLDVTLLGTPKHIRLEVLDHGHGFSVHDMTNAQGLGLNTMRDRIRMMGGELAIESQPGCGTKIIASAPLSPTDHLSSGQTFTVQISA